MTRRSLLTGVSASILADAIPAHAITLPALHGGVQQPPPVAGGALAVSLAFPDGNTLMFDQTSATDVGDYVSAIGGFTQKCFRQRSSGHGDYRDNFTVFFRPDADGTRQEVIVEYQTEWVFSTTAQVVLPAAGVAGNLFIPPSPVLSKTTGNTSGQSGTCWACVSYVFPTGECVPSKGVSMVLAVGDLLMVPSPPPMAGAIAYRIYAHTNNFNLTCLQAELPIGTDWTEPNTGFVLNSAREKFVSTATVYTATITGSGIGAPVVIPVKSHWSKARWRWYSAKRPVVRTYANLLAEKSIFPMDVTYLYGAVLPNSVTWSGPMGTAGLLVAWGGQADRPDLAFMNDYLSAWLLTGASNAAIETSWRALAEATGSCQWWWRDITTGALFDTSIYPYLSETNIGAAKFTLPSFDPKGTCANYFLMDNSHTPDMAFIAWRLTDDPYFLEGAQATALWAVSSTNQPDGGLGLPYLLSTVQPRAWAWGVRDLFRAAGYSPISVPSWLQDRSYWTGVLDNNFTYASRYLTSTTLQCSVFHAIPHTNVFEGFMENYITICISWVKYCGRFPDWDPIVVYAQLYQETISDVNDTLGWDHRLQAPYYIRLIDARLGATAASGPGGNYATPSTVNTAANWGEAWTGLLGYAPTDPTNFGNWSDPATWADDTLRATQYGFLPYVRAALAAVAASGSTTAPANHVWLAAHMSSDFPSTQFIGHSSYKWAISPS